MKRFFLFFLIITQSACYSISKPYYMLDNSFCAATNPIFTIPIITGTIGGEISLLGGSFFALAIHIAKEAITFFIHKKVTQITEFNLEKMHPNAPPQKTKKSLNKKTKNKKPKKNDNESWDMPLHDSVINKRRFTQHALERMAPDTPQIRAELCARTHERAISKGFMPETAEYLSFIKASVDPRGIPPSVIENIISTTIPLLGKYPETLDYVTEEIKVVTNFFGDVITVIPK